MKKTLWFLIGFLTASFLLSGGYFLRKYYFNKLMEAYNYGYSIGILDCYEKENTIEWKTEDNLAMKGTWEKFKKNK